MQRVSIITWKNGENPVTSRGEIKETEIDIFPNSPYLENSYIKVDINPPLLPNVYKYPPVMNNGKVLPSQFDAGVVFNGIDLSTREMLGLGFQPGPKIEILVDYCDVPNAWFDYYSIKIEVCKGIASDGDVSVHEYGHADLFFQLPQLGIGNATENTIRFHEYYADVMAATTARNWKLGEYSAIEFGMVKGGKNNGIRDPLAKFIKWEEGNRLDDPHIASLVFSGVIARVWQRLTRSTGRYRMPEDKAFLFIRALVRNQPNFIPRQNDLSPQDFYWSLAGSLNGLYTSGQLKKIIGSENVDAWTSYLHMAIRQECVRTGLVSESEVVKAAVKIKDRPADFVSEAPTQTQVFRFHGGQRKTIQQTTRLIFKKDGAIIKTENVIVVGYSATEYVFNDGTPPVTFYDGARKLDGVDLEVQNYVPPQDARQFLIKEFQSGDKLKKAIEQKVPINAEMDPAEQKRRAGARNILFARADQSLRGANPANLKQTLVLIDGKNNVQYRFQLGLISAYVDIRTGAVDFAVNAFID